MPKIRQKIVFICQQCGNESPKWTGQCLSCGDWNSLVETTLAFSDSGANKKIRAAKEEAVLTLSKIEGKEVARTPTGFLELDRVLGGGIVPGQVILLAGEPGIGKSTLLLQLADRFKNKTVLYACGEESPIQIKLRADRLGIPGENIMLYPEMNVENLVAKIQEFPQLKLLIIDSVQTLVSDQLTGISGSVGQVRFCTQRLIQVCKELSIPLFLIGQVTKEGTIAGPKVLEHAVDTVLYIEGERMEEIRLLRCFKNRFGIIDELAVFRMGEKGLEDVSDASKLFLEEESLGSAGTLLCPIIAGARVLLIEVQSLVVASPLSGVVSPRRVSQGFSRARLEMIVAILQKHLQLPLFKFDIFINFSGGLLVDDPGADLAIALAIYSSLKNKPFPKKACAFGELTLLSGIRPVLQKKKRMEEARRLGSKNIYSSETAQYLTPLIKRILS